MNEALRWGLAMGALLMRDNGQDLSVLGGIRSQEPSEKESVRKALKRDWDIDTRDDLLATIQWLIGEGHRKELVEICMMADHGAVDLDDDEELERKVAFVHRHRDRFTRFARICREPAGAGGCGPRRRPIAKCRAARPT